MPDKVEVKSGLRDKLKKTKRTIEDLEARLKESEARNSALAESERLLFESAFELDALPPGADLYEVIARQVNRFVKDAIVAITAYDAATDTFRTCALSGKAKGLNDFSRKILGIDLLDIKIPAADFNRFLDRELSDAFYSGRLTRIDEVIYRFFKIPPRTARLAKTALGIGCIYAAGFKYNEKLFGTVDIFLRKGSRFENKSAVETFIRLASVALQRKEALEDLHRTKDELELIFESSPAAIIVYDMDSRVVRWSPAAERIFGWRSDEVVGGPNPIIPPQMVEGLKIRFQEMLEGRTYILPVEVVSLRKDGTKLNMHLSVALIRDRSGRPQGIVNVLTDLTELKKTEARLVESENRYRAVFETSGAATLIFDKKGVITSRNMRMGDISGYPKEEIEGKRSWEEFIPPVERAMMMDNFRKRQADPSAAPTHYESKFIARDGTIRNIMITVDAIPGTDEYVSSILDITDLRNTEQSLKKSLEEKEMLLKEIHHRVKNNLMVISSLLNLQSKSIKDQEVLDIFRESQNRAKSMALIHQRLYQSSDLKHMNFGDYLRTLVKDLFRTYAAGSGQVGLKMDVDDVMLDIDTTVPMGLIVNELVCNGLKHAFPQGRSGSMGVHFHKSGEDYVLRVVDDGVGFPEDLDFRKTKSLGLQIVNDLTDQIRGTVELVRGGGTEFKITFKGKTV